jgi:predicted metal-dependent HD superfamily phosphohydrolase
MTLALPFSLPSAVEARLRAAYASPPRAYHNFDHVAEVLSHFHSVGHWEDFLDCDMAILGADQPRYARYEQQIESEYAAVPVQLFRAGRARFIEKVLALPRIYLSETFHARLEQRARANLAAALAALG